ncbi:MAG: DegQ family serine endoprotease [Bryobacteraceae bacterium]
MRLAKYLGSRRKAVLVAAATFTIGCALGVAAVTAEHSGPWPPASVKVATRSGSEDARGYSRVLKAVLPAVVNISSSRVTRQDTRGMQDQSQMDPFFRQFFGDEGSRRFNIPKERREKSLGSGVIVSPEGYVLTNNHVVEHATEITVTLRDKREMKAQVVGADPRTDIAVLKIDGTNFPYVTLGDSSKVEVGDIALAIGDPFGVGQTVTAGIVSAMGRGNLGIEEVEDFIQTDAPINPGNSGGALIDDEGHLIGINTAILSGNSGGNQGIGFAVPVNLASHIMDQILKTGKVERAYLGILPQDVTPAMAKAFGAQETKGAVVGDITANSPASHSDLKQGDIIVAVNGKSIEDANQLRLEIGMLSPGSTATLSVLRDGKPQQVAVKLGDFPSKQERASLDNNAPDSSLEGVQVQNLTPDTAREMNLAPESKGVVVADVDPSSHAADAGLRTGDVIQQVNHQSVKSVQDFEHAMASAKKGDPTLLLVNRGGNTLFVAV